MSNARMRVYLQTVHHKDDPALPVFKKYFAPIQVGRRQGAADLGVDRDDRGENIAHKNASYCELTAMYWVWKNIQADYYGLMHYRRIFTARAPSVAHNVHMLKQYFSGVGECFRYDRLGTLWPANRVITDTRSLESECRALQAFVAEESREWDVLLPSPVFSRKLSMARQYAICNCQCDYLVMLDCIRERFPEMEKAAREASASRTFHLYNMFIMRKSVFEEYAECVFRLLADVEPKIDVTHRDAYQRRVFGFLAERFMNIFVRHLVATTKVRVVELPTVFLDLA